MDPGAFRTEQVEGMAKGRVRCRIQLMSGQRAGRAECRQDLLRDYSRLARSELSNCKSSAVCV